MITVRTIPHSGALEISAHIRDIALGGSWYERQVYYGYNKTEAKRKYREHLNEKHYVLVND
jgi:hypothetical protein